LLLYKGTEGTACACLHANLVAVEGINRGFCFPVVNDDPPSREGAVCNPRAGGVACLQTTLPRLGTPKDENSEQQREKKQLENFYI